MSATAARVNRTLTNYAAGVAQDTKSALASKLAPTVATGVAHGQYKRYSEKNHYQVYDTSRAMGGGRKRIEFSADDPFFNCKPQALEVAIDDHERKMAGDGILNIQQAKISTLVSSATISHEKKVFDAVRAAKAAESGKGVWSNAANDPIADLDEQIEAIATATGRMPNRIIFGLGAWRVFRNHAKVLARQPGAELIGVTTDQGSRMTINPAIEILVGVMSVDATKFGATKNASSIIGADVFIFYTSDAPTPYDSSFAKTFSVEQNLVGDVREYREEGVASDIYYMDWTADIQVTAPDSGRRLTLS